MPDPTGMQTQPAPGSPDDIYSAIIQGMPTDADRQRAMAQQLRTQNILGNIGLGSGDRVMAPEGKSLIDQTKQGLDLYNTEQNEQNKLGLSYDEMAQREQIAQMQDARARDLNAAILGSRERVASLNRQGRVDVAKLRGLQTAGGPTDPDDERLLAMARASGIPGIPNNPKYANAWAHGLNVTYGQRDENGALTNQQDILDALVSNKHEYFGEQRRLAVANTQVGKTGTAIDEMDRWAPILEDDMSKLGNVKLKIGNSIMNVARDQLNDPDLIALQDDLVTFKKALAQAQGRGSDTTGVERMASWKLLMESQNHEAFMTSLQKMRQEATVMQAAAEHQARPRTPGARLTPVQPQPGGGGQAGTLPPGASVDENGEVKLGPADTSPAGVNDGVPVGAPGPHAMRQNGGPVVTTPAPPAPAPAAPAPPARKPGTLNKALQYMPGQPTSMLPNALKRYYGNLG